MPDVQSIVALMLRRTCDRGWILVALALGLLAAGAAAAYADALDGVLEVRSAYVAIDHGVYKLHARVEYPKTPAIRDALQDGVTLTFELDTRVARERHLWFDATVVNLTLHRELAYHTVSDRYVVRNVSNGRRDSFQTLTAALEFLGRIDGWPILVEPQLRDGDHYRISVRAGIRRGRLPASLRMLLFWTNDWHRVSAWYTWSLPR